MPTVNQRGRYGRYLNALLSLSELVVLNIIFVVTTLLCPDILQQRPRELFLVINIAYLPVMYWMGHIYRQRAIQMEHIIRVAIIKVCAHASVFMLLMTFLGVDISPTIGYLEFYGLLIVTMPLWSAFNRWAIKRLRRKGYNFSRVLIVGTNATARKLIEEIHSDAGFGYRIMAFCGEVNPGNLEYDFIHIRDLDTYVKDAKIDEIFYTLIGENAETLSRVIKVADDNVVQFYYVPQISRYLTRGFEMYNIGSVPVLSLRHNPLKSIINRCIKRTFDIIFSSIALLLSPLVFIPVGIAIKLSSPGPIFFRQERTGYRGRPFKMWKFRTMVVNNTSDRDQATENDPRKTRLGNILRKTSIDELPQFINVWLGHMSVVGPRPHMIKHTEDYSQLINKYMLRHVVKPGITGWAQINGYRGITDQLWKMEKRVEYDVWYIEHWSLLLDLKIIVRTVTNAIVGEKNAF